MTKYDDASWHSEGNFPADLPPEAGATHIGIYLAWAVVRDLASEFLENKQLLIERKITPGEFLLQECDGKLTDEDLNELGNRFSSWYYSSGNSLYFEDLRACFAEDNYSDIYYVPDSWDSFQRIASRIDNRFSLFLSDGG